MTLARRLPDVLERLSRATSLLIACDFDGTLAPIVDHPRDVVPHRTSLTALRTLAAMPNTHVVVISGRPLDDLADHIPTKENIHLVGSHGAESSGLPPIELNQSDLKIRDELKQLVADLVDKYPGSLAEPKPYGVAFHYRNVALDQTSTALADAIEGPGSLPGVVTLTGKMVIEFSVRHINKGVALSALRQAVGAVGLLVIGDDVTDEDSFAVAGPGDVSIKVGEGPSIARYRVETPSDVSSVLATVVERRSLWIGESPSEEIVNHSLLSDLKTLAIVQPNARITWMCAPRADSPSVFAQLVGQPTDGYFAIEPADGRPSINQRYLEDSMILETAWSGLIVTDYFGLKRDGQRSGADNSPSLLVRTLEGHCTVRIEFAPRPNYAQDSAQLTLTRTGIEMVDSHATLRLHAPGVVWSLLKENGNDTAVASVTLQGAPLVLTLEIFEPGTEPVSAMTPQGASFDETLLFWQDWIDRLSLPSRATSQVRRSALTLKSLTHAASGSILAAGTTSLPEDIGGTRNWDYRFCWPRDSSMIAAALVSLGSLSEADALLHWLHERVKQLPSPDQMKPVYPIVGDVATAEAELANLAGYRESRPVRIGNGADSQVQMDVFGPIITLIDQCVASGMELSDERWTLVENLAAAVAKRWDEPDFGIWEERRPTRHHVHSKVMCWTAIDRAIDIGTRTGRPVPDSWHALREEIAAQVLAKGWNEDVGAYTIAYGDDALDAAVLHLAISGLLAGDDPRFVSTVGRIEETLRHGPTVYRYALDDGFREAEGGFNICTTWLIEAYALMGRYDDAQSLFDDYLRLVGPTGLLSEEYEPFEKISLGNFPQAYSHLGLIRTARILSELDE